MPSVVGPWSNGVAHSRVLSTTRYPLCAASAMRGLQQWHAGFNSPMCTSHRFGACSTSSASIHPGHWPYKVLCLPAVVVIISRSVHLRLDVAARPRSRDALLTTAVNSCTGRPADMKARQGGRRRPPVSLRHWRPRFSLASAHL